MSRNKMTCCWPMIENIVILIPLKDTCQVGSITIVNFICELSKVANSKVASIQPYTKQLFMNGVKTI